MRKLFLIIFIFTAVFAQNYEIKLFSQLFTVLFNKQPVYIYTENTKYKNIDSNFLKYTDICEKADLVLDKSHYCKNKPTFLLDYYDYVNDKNAIGAFYWRKGRPQLRLRRQNLLKYNLNISPEFKDYME